MRSAVQAVVAALIIVAAVAVGVSAYVLMNPTTVTSTVTTTTTVTVTTTPPSNNYTETLKQLRSRIAELREKGYDVLKAEYYLLSAKYLWMSGRRDAALEMIRAAEDYLRNPPLLPEARNPAIRYEVVPNVTSVERVPTSWDFVPLNTVFVLTKEGYLEYPRNDYGSWKLSCFILGAIGRDSEGRLVLYQGRLPMKPEENPFKPKIYVGGKWFVPNIVFAGPLYYRNGSNYVEVYEYDLSGRYVETLKYYPANRTWVHVIAERGGRTILRVVARGEGIPMWLGEWGKTFLVHGAYPKAKGFDLWAGFWDVGPMNATISVGGRTIRVTGYLIVDRASHRAFPIQGSEVGNAGGAPLAFSCMVIRQGSLTIMITNTSNPSPANPPASPEHQIRINVPSLNFSAATTNFTLRDNGGLQPSTFTLVAWFKGGYLNLTGKAVIYWPSRWPTGAGTWWRGDSGFSWGRAFIRWEGTVLIHGITLRVNTLGMGEFTRYSPTAPNPTATCPEGGGCWCTSTKGCTP